jgi:hypothetical protein
MPKLEATWARMTAAPAAVVPPLPKRAPRSLVSISAKKLSDGVLVSAISVPIRGDPAEPSVWAARGVVPAVTRTRRGTLTPAACSAATNSCPASRAGWVKYVDPSELAQPRL